MKNRVEMPAGKLRLNAVLEKLWQHILIDFIMKSPVLRGYDSILIVYNKFLISHFITMTEKIIVKGLAKLLMKKLNEVLEIETKLLTAFHPQTDRQMEKTNQELE